TIYAPVNTGYTFEEANRIDPVTHDFVMDIDTSFIQLPIIGTMDATFNVKKFSFTLTALPNGGQRLAIGRIFRFDNNYEKEQLPDDGGLPDEKNPGKFRPYSLSDIMELGEGIKKFGTKLKDKGSLGMRNWGVGMIGGVYLDFGFKDIQYTDEVARELVLIGGGLYVGGTAKFRVVQYIAIYGIPFYVGAEGELTIFNQTGLTAINERTATLDRISSEANSFSSELKTSTLLQANTTVSGYFGVGLCGTLGVRGGAYFYANLLWYPTIKNTYPDYHELGAIVSLNLRVWADVLLFPIPYSITGFEEKYGYFKDVEDSTKEEMDILSVSDEVESNITMKDRTSRESEWMPEKNGPMLRSTFLPDTSTVLVENGYDRADSQLLDLGDGRIMLAFIADDPERSDEERTALMYSINDNGVWSEPVKVQDDGTADFEPDICDGGNKVHITWTSREPGLGYTSATEYLKSMDVYTTTLDKATLTIGEIERLTDDEFYDSDPKGMYDKNSGDYLVYYLKADVSEDFIKSMSPTTNESVIVYMLYDAKEGKWARDYYYDNEVESEEAEDILVEHWGGQRFLSSPIEDFGMNDPIIIDFDSVSYNNLGVYTFTVDEDNNVDTIEDRELFVQVYDFQKHATYVPIRITNDNITDARPQLVRNGENTYLFWLQNNKDVRYINISELIREGVNDDGTIKENYDVSVGAVFFTPSNGT
ncbi:MAG: hypothetical protein U0M60_15840, partial [Clostridia bacterium]|nr:hypothetical protein [Clostridia bacterium]